MRFTGFISVLTTFWPLDFNNPFVYPLEFRKVHMQVPCGTVRMPYENTCMIGPVISRGGRAGPMRGPYGAHMTQQTTEPAKAPVQYLHDCLWTQNDRKPLYERCVCSIVKHRLYGTRTCAKSSKNRAGLHGMPCDHPWVLRVLAVTEPVNYPEVPGNRDIISILWQPMRVVAKVGSPGMGSMHQ